MEHREAAGLSQAALAKRMGTSQSAISQIEQGERNPSFETVSAAAIALGISLAQLVGAREEQALSDEERAHFRNLRELDPRSQQELRNFAAFLAQRRGRPTK